jgi:hypothetical protein
MQKPDQKTIERMRKLLELARRGVGGEAANAERFLHKLLAKHGMTLSDITASDQKRIEVSFKYRTDEDRKLLVQIISKVLDSSEYTTWKVRGKRVLIVNLTPAEHAEVLMHHAVMVPALEAHMKRAMMAFIQVNQIYPSTSREAKGPRKPMEKEELESILKMMSATKRVDVRKALPHAI